MKRTIIVLIGDAATGKTILGNLLAPDARFDRVVDLEEIANGGTKAELRNYYGLCTRLVICVKDLGSRKNSQALLSVLEILKPDQQFAFELTRSGRAVALGFRGQPLKRK